MGGRTIIIGAGQAGVQVALSLRQAGYEGEIVLAGKENHVPYQRPPLSKQVLRREWAAERCQLRHLEFYEQHDIQLLLGHSATRLDTKLSRVEFEDGAAWEFDELAICTGSRLNRLTIRGADLPGVCYLRTLDDALDLASRFGPGVHLVVIGAGYIGLEVAAAARSLGCQVTVVEALDQVMKRSALPGIANFLHRRHETEGVQFRMNSKLTTLVGNKKVEGVELEDGSMIPADTVLIGVGVRPDLSWLEGSDIETQRGVLVNPSCKTSVENVHAAGDVTELCHPLLEGWHVLESVQNAVSQGKLIAASILGKTESYSEAPWFWSEQYDCRLQMAGIPHAGSWQVSRNNPDTGGLSIFSLSGKRLNAVQCVNSPREYMLGRRLITHQVEVSADQLGNPRYNLKDLI